MDMMRRHDTKIPFDLASACNAMPYAYQFKNHQLLCLHVDPTVIRCQYAVPQC